VVLEAELNDGQRVPVATLRIRPPALKPVARPGLLPLCKIGFGRSGTTWLMRLLREHPAIVVAGGFPYEVAALRHWSRLAHFLAQSSPTQLEGDRQFDWVRCDPRHHQELMETDAGRWLLSDDVEDGLSALARRIESFYRLVALDQGRTGAVYFAEKTISLLAIRLAEQLYPGLGQIVLVRDFRDVAASVNSFNAHRGFLGVGRQFSSSDQDHFRRQAEMVRQLLRYWHERKGRAVLVRYEDLVHNPHTVLERVFAHLGLDASSGLVAGVVERASREDDETRAHRTTSSSSASVGRWRRDLDPAQVRLIEDMMGEALEGFGYPWSARRAAA
jgi:hypothetical protein